MWGQVIFCSVIALITRIIPTRVGTRATSSLISSSTWDHPHACGDKLPSSCQALSDRGSSPRVWGQVPHLSQSTAKCRIIPTRVGTRGEDRHYLCEVWDHPHACGDKTVIGLMLAMSAGSSPRVWGQVYTSLRLTNSSRIIPTRVGTRSERKTRMLYRWDHPHACGDKKLQKTP